MIRMNRFSTNPNICTYKAFISLIFISFIKNIRLICAGIFIVILLMGSAAGAGQQLKVSSSRYSVYNPWLINANYSFNLSGNFTAFALLLNNGLPDSGENITFEIYANGTLKSTQYNLTQQNGLASVSYNTIGQFTDKNDTDYGNWTITAYLTTNSTVKGSTNMSLEGWANTNTTTCGSHDSFCHKLNLMTSSNNFSGYNYARSPYTSNYGRDFSFGKAAHYRSSHSSNNYRGCYICHPGYSVNKTGNYGSTNDVHKNRTCDFCHGNWTYIRTKVTGPTGGAGLPKIPSCYDCHPQYNDNLTAISTLANLAPGIPPINVTGVNISVYSYNYDTGAPLTAHNGTYSSLIASVPCIVCHGPAHNNTIPDPSLLNTNSITESIQCISCHGQKHAAGTNCTDCHTQDAHAITRPETSDCASCHSSYSNAVNNSMHNKTRNVAAPDCTLCHINYDNSDSGHTGFIVNESNSCRNSGCHVQNVSGFYERHTSTSDCSACHFANTTSAFDQNTSLYTHDHNLTVEHNFYEYNISGMPVRTNGGLGAGMFPYYTCTLTCHRYNATTGVEGKVDEAAISWFNSSHARSLHMSGDNKMSCARCKSPANYNVSANQSSLIAQADWQGIQCRVCHNLHDRRFPNNTGPGGLPVAFYNGTASSRTGYAVYDKVSNTTELCEKCHYGTSHDSKFAGTHKNTAGFNCTNCHMNSSFNSELHVFEVKNTTSGVTGCEVCHNNTNHINSFSYTVNHTGIVTCEACHDKTVARNVTGYAVSSDNKSYGLWNDTATGIVSSWKDSHGSPATWPLHNISREVSCFKCHGTKSKSTNMLIAPITGLPCISCHDTYVSAVNNSMHNQTKYPSTPNCTLCHNGYEVQHTGFIVNESNTCRNSGCHVQNINGFFERHSSSSDCTSCHFANTTRSFGLNSSLYAHDHNMTVEHSFYEYNISGMPVRTNGGAGLGMFPYYACTLTCHKYNATTGVEGKIDVAASDWLESRHAQASIHGSRYNSSCLPCHSPPLYNSSNGATFAASEWLGVQCRVCHNLHDRRHPNYTGPGGWPVAFYNATNSSLFGYSAYDAVTNATALCEKCHIASHREISYGGFHRANISFTCISCHGNSTFNNKGHTFEVKNTASGVTGCEVCHDTADHTWSSTSLHINKVTCEACHDQKFVVNATSFSVFTNGVSSNDFGIYKNSTTNKWTTYKVSSGSPKPWSLHNLSRSVNCSKCHEAYSPWNGSLRQNTLIVGNLTGGRSCVSCHDTGGLSGKPVDFEGAGNGIHMNLNNGTLSPSGYLSSNFKCWACHGDGDGSEAAQPSGNSHPLNYRTPKNCNNNTCHSISQSRYKESMIYSHFRNSSLNNNPGNVTNYNITAGARCETCHANSLVKEENASNLALVSHYGSKIDLPDSFNCVYCHLDEDNSEDWGDATLIHKNRTALMELEKEQKKFLGFVGSSVYLGEGYSLKVRDISILRGDALIQLSMNGQIVDEFLLSPGNTYKYEKDITIDNSTFRTPVITLNITSIFTGELIRFIQLEGSRIKKVHTVKESKNSACYACHLYRYSAEKQRYMVIDREYDEDSDKDTIHYTDVLADFNSDNRSKVYFNDEDFVFTRLDGLGKSLSFSAKQKYLQEGENWNIADGYSFRLNEVSTDDKEAWLTLSIKDNAADDQIVKKGLEFKYTPGIRYKDNTNTNVTVFNAKVTSIFQGKTNFILLQDVVALSPKMMNTTANTTLFGYNSSWLNANDTFVIGKIPESLHSPNMFTDMRTWADCAGCHDSSKNLRISSINAISSGLGKHSILNAGGSNETLLSDPVDKACWACHTGGAEPLSHSPTYNIPRNCKSCHTYREEPYYGAKYVGDEEHGQESNCESCHMLESHSLIGPDTLPTVRDVTLSRNKTNMGEPIKISARAMAGYKMKIKAAEYFIDTNGESGKGTPLAPSDGAFDSQNEDLKADIDTDGLSEGEHLVYVHSMERNNKWGKFEKINFTIDNEISSGMRKLSPGPGLFSLMIAFIIACLAAYRRNH